ncbi:MAG: fibronectin type III domain-containing protein [Flavobacteriales bacterium]|nr:fibronectin type III domain-containing protein [Flavobacteriales bacterium]
MTLLAWGFAALSLNAQTNQRTARVAERMEELHRSGVEFRHVPLFSLMERSAESDALWENAVTQATVVRLDRSVTSTLMVSRSAYISLELPAESAPIIVDLERVDITTADFQVTLASTGAAANIDQGVHYRGTVRGVTGSMAAISVFPDEVMGIISDAEGQRVLGRFVNDTQGDHIFYREADLLGTSSAVCATPDVDMGEEPAHLDESGADRTVKCVRYYWEVNYDIFQGKGSVVNAVNYVTGLFNQSAILYENDGISVALSEVYVWDVPSPYTSTSTSTQLSTFGTTRTSFNGDMAHLLGYTGGGGVAYVNTICSSQSRYRMAYSDINSTYQNVPTYSWSVEVVTHEQGHNLGSPHTHACSWNGNNTAIDGCGPAAGYTEGSCAAGPVPASSVGGTIMSYCHLTGSGIKFSNGFGPQPAALIISRINAASCLTACGSGTPCSAPTGLAVSNTTTTGATLGWAAVPGAASYTLQWKANAAATWTTVTGIASTTYALSGLTAGTAYQFQVSTVCASSSSSYASPVSFTTTVAATCGVPSGLSASSISTTSATVNWSAVSGAVSYNVQWKLASASSWTTITGATGTSRTLTGLTPSTAYQFQVSTVCGASSSAYSGAASFTTSAASSCGVPTGLSASSITASSGTLNWTAVSGAVSYTVQWKPASSSTWNTITGITGTSRSLTGLAASTVHQFQVSAVCSASSSAYSAATNFTTSAVVACSDNYEPNNSRSAAFAVASNITLTGRISTWTDQDWYRFSNSTGASNIRVTLTGLPANYSIALYRGSSNIASSNVSGTGNETIVFNTTTVSTNYSVRVRGVNGAYNSTACYTLSISTSGTGFMSEGLPQPDEDLNATGDVEGEVLIFPNPASELVNIRIPASPEVTYVDIYDAVGRNVASFNHPGGEVETTLVLPVAERSPGVHLIRIARGEEVIVRRVVVSH